MPDRGIWKTLYRWRVRAGSPAIAAVLILARPLLVSLLIGIGVSLLGLGLRAWAAGHLRKEKTLAVSGPYRFTRNPLYLGTLLIGTGMAAGSRSWPAAALMAVYFAIFYPVIVLVERNRMRRLFPEAYEAYERKVLLFFPSFGKIGAGTGARFDRGLFAKNKEVRAILGAAAFWCLMALKTLFIHWPR